MATDIYRKRKNKSKKKGSKKKQPFRVLAPSFETEREFNRGVENRARGMYQPLLDDLSGQERTEQRRNLGRTQDLRQWQGQYQGTLNDAFADTQKALNDLIAINTGSDTAVQNSMRAALERMGTENAGMESLLGGEINEAPALSSAAASLAGPSAMTQGFNRNVGAMLTGAGERRSLAGLAGARGIEQENIRNRSVLEDLANSRADIMGRVPSFQEQARAALMEEELSKQNQRFQQGLATDQFGFQRKESNRNFRLQSQNLKFQQWLAEAGFNLDKFQAEDQSRLSWGQLAIDRDRLALQAEEIRSNPGKFGEMSAKRYQNAVSLMTEYMKPTDEDRNPVGKNADGTPLKNGGKVNPKFYKKNHTPEALYNQLTGVVRLTPAAALRLMTTVNNSNIRDWARRKSGRIGAPGRQTPGNAPGPGNQGDRPR